MRSAASGSLDFNFHMKVFTAGTRIVAQPVALPTSTLSQISGALWRSFRFSFDCAVMAPSKVVLFSPCIKVWKPEIQLTIAPHRAELRLRIFQELTNENTMGDVVCACAGSQRRSTDGHNRNRHVYRNNRYDVARNNNAGHTGSTTDQTTGTTGTAALQQTGTTGTTTPSTTGTTTDQSTGTTGTTGTAVPPEPAAPLQPLLIKPARLARQELEPQARPEPQAREWVPLEPEPPAQQRLINRHKRHNCTTGTTGTGTGTTGTGTTTPSGLLIRARQEQAAPAEPVAFDLRHRQHGHKRNIWHFGHGHVRNQRTIHWNFRHLGTGTYGTSGQSTGTSGTSGTGATSTTGTSDQSTSGTSSTGAQSGTAGTSSGTSGQSSSGNLPQTASPLPLFLLGGSELSCRRLVGKN